MTGAVSHLNGTKQAIMRSWWFCFPPIIATYKNITKKKKKKKSSNHLN